MIEADKYLIYVEGGPPSNYSAYSPDVQGCAATGATVDECVAEMRSTLEFHLERMQEDGEALPAPSGPGVYVEHRSVA